MKHILLTGDKVAMVDDDDYEMLNEMTWHTGNCGPKIYARRNKDKQFMHRIIIGAKGGQIIDHINGDPLDNRRENLRVCTQAQNLHNRGKNVNNKSGYKGVHFNKTNKRWVAQITVKSKCKHLGSFKEKEDAAIAYNNASKKCFGAFSVPNKVSK